MRRRALTRSEVHGGDARADEQAQVGSVWRRVDLGGRAEDSRGHVAEAAHDRMLRVGAPRGELAAPPLDLHGVLGEPRVLVAQSRQGTLEIRAGLGGGLAQGDAEAPLGDEQVGDGGRPVT